MPIRKIIEAPDGARLDVPFYLAICDIVTCQNMATYEPSKEGQNASLVAAMTSPAAAQQVDPIVGCIQSLVGAGWGISWLQVRCSRHEAQAHQYLAKQQSRIVLPNGPIPNGGRKH